MAGLIQEITRNMIRTILFAAFVFFITPRLQGQVNLWPIDLQLPDTNSVDRSDSNDISLLSQRALYMNAVTAGDSFVIKQSSRTHVFQMLDYYRLEKNDLFQSKKQYFDLSGILLKKNVLFHWLSVGIDWMPVVLLNSNRNNQALLGSLDGGPAIHSDFLSIPITVRGGAAGKLQNDSFALNDPKQAWSNHAVRDKGFYGAFDVGSENIPLSGLPLLINAKGFGRSLQSSHLLSGMGSALFCRDLPSGDTLSLLYADSVMNGGGAMLGDEGAQGKSFFVDIPQSMTRSYQMKGGIHGKYRLHLQPALFLSYARHSIEYPTDNGNPLLHTELADRRNSVQSVNALLNSDPSYLVNYSGGLRVDLEKEEKLFQNDINFTRVAGPSNRDSFNVKLNDYNGYRATMTHIVSAHARGGAGIDYSYTVARYLKTYPHNYFLFHDTTPAGELDTIRNDDDKDWIVQNHIVELTPLSKQWGEVVAHGEYSTNLSYFLKRRKSANNSVDYIYKLGLRSFFLPLSNVKIEHKIESDVKRTVYVFPEDYAKLGFLPPSYSREISMELSLRWHNQRFPDYMLEWNEHYEDDGYWYGKESVSDSLTASFSPYYGIERIQWRHSCTFNISDTIVRLVWYEAGSSVEYINQKKFDAPSRLYVRDDNQTRYIFGPYVIIESVINPFFKLKTRIKRNIDTVKDSYWDFTLMLMARF
jgi:hypothetical protein